MPRLIVPSSGGGRKLMRTLLGGVAEGEGDSSGVGETVGDCSDVGEGVGFGDSCANAAQTEAKPIRIATLSFLVMSSEVSRHRGMLF